MRGLIDRQGRDIIYREDVTELIKKSRNSIDWDEADAGAFFHWTAKLNRDIDKLPSAERTGKWELCGNHHLCSECDEWALTKWDEDECDEVDVLTDFCPHCGADMREQKLQNGDNDTLQSGLMSAI